MPTYYYPRIEIRNPKLYMNIVRFDDLKTALFGNNADRPESTTLVNQLLTGTVTSARYNTLWTAFLRNGFRYSELPMVTPYVSGDPSTGAIETFSYPVYTAGTSTVPPLNVPESVLPKTTDPRTERLFLLVGYSADLSITDFQTVSVYGAGNPTIQPDRSRVWINLGRMDSEAPVYQNTRPLKWVGKISAEHYSSHNLASSTLTIHLDSGERDWGGGQWLTGDGFELTEGSGARLIYRTTLYGEYLNAYSSTGTTSYGSPASAPITPDEAQKQQIDRSPNCISIFEIGTMTDLLGSSVVNPFIINFESFKIFDSTLAFFVGAELTQSGQTNGLTAMQTVPITSDAGFSEDDRDLTPRDTTEMVISKKTLNFGKIPFTHSIMLQILKVNPENVTHYLGYKETQPRDRTEDGMIDRSVHFYFWCKKFPSGPMNSIDPSSPSVNIRLSNGTGIPTDNAYYAHENTVMKYMDTSGGLKEFLQTGPNSRDYLEQTKARLAETPAGYYDKYFTLPVFLRRNRSITPGVWNERSKYRSMIATSAGGSIRTFPDITNEMIRSGGLESELQYDDTGHLVMSMTQNVGYTEASIEPGTTDPSTYWMYRGDTADADIYRQSIKYGPFFFEPELAENDQERTSETRRYTFYFHYFFFDYMSWMTGLWSDPSYDRDFETWKVLDTTDFPFLDTDQAHYADEGTEDIVRKELTLNQKYLMLMKPKVGSDGHPIWPWDNEDMLLMWCLMTPNSSNFQPEIEKDRIFEYDTNYGNNMTPLSRKYTDTDELLCKNQVYPFELWWDLDQDEIQSLDDEGFGEFLAIVARNPSVYPLFTDRLTPETTGTISTYVDDQISSDLQVSEITYISRETN